MQRHKKIAHGILKKFKRLRSIWTKFVNFWGTIFQLPICNDWSCPVLVTNEKVCSVGWSIDQCDICGGWFDKICQQFFKKLSCRLYIKHDLIYIKNKYIWIYTCPLCMFLYSQKILEGIKETIKGGYL